MWSTEAAGRRWVVVAKLGGPTTGVPGMESRRELWLCLSLFGLCPSLAVRAAPAPVIGGAIEVSGPREPVETDARGSYRLAVPPSLRGRVLTVRPRLDGWSFTP